MFKCPQNGILGSAESSQTFLVKKFSFNSHEKNYDLCAFEIEFWYRIVDLKQLPGLKKTKMVMYSITTKLNSTSGTTGKAAADKMTAKFVGKRRLGLLEQILPDS